MGVSCRSALLNLQQNRCRFKYMLILYFSLLILLSCASVGFEYEKLVGSMYQSLKRSFLDRILLIDLV
jgi:hypothetical protein